MKNIPSEKGIFSGLHFSAKYLTWTGYGLLLLITFLLQSAPHGLPVLWGIRAYPLLLVVVTAAMFEGAVGGAVIGVCAGLLWDMYGSRLFGLRALFFLVVGVSCGLLVQLLIRNNILSALLLASGTLLIFGLGDWLLIYVIFGNPEPIGVLLRLVLPSMLYTLAFTPLMYFINYYLVRLLHNRQ